MSIAKEFMTQLREQSLVTRGWVDAQVQRVAPELARSFGIERAHGALVVDVEPNSPV